ncbi:MAG: hypothetical protein KC517_04910 [Bacteroidetes bacterium]|jgi:hypothetical protein|nr:hypothetical protein [Bacteroidota bacterium]
MIDLEKMLHAQKQHSEVFSENFTEGVMAKIRALGNQEFRIISLWQHRVWKVAAACFVGCLISLYALDGTLSVDSVLGLSEYSDIEISQSYNTYSAWDLELN